MRSLKAVVICGIVLIPISGAFAQFVSSPDSSAQELNRQQERERVWRQQQEQTPTVRLPGRQTEEALGRLSAGEALCFDIQRIVLNGEAAEQFQWALVSANQTSDGIPDAAIGRCMGTHSISLVMKRVQNAIIERGFVTTRVLAQPARRRRWTAAATASIVSTVNTQSNTQSSTQACQIYWRKKRRGRNARNF